MKLKPCPFFGSNLTRHTAVARIGRAIQCRNCGATGPIVHGTVHWSRSPEEAWNQWLCWSSALIEKLLRWRKK